MPPAYNIVRPIRKRSNIYQEVLKMGCNNVGGAASAITAAGGFSLLSSYVACCGGWGGGCGGCGTGSGLRLLSLFNSPPFKQEIKNPPAKPAGFDISFSWVIIGRSYLIEKIGIEIRGKYPKQYKLD
jgi:hypothetical protein